MDKNNLVLQLALLSVGALIIVCLTVLIACGHDGTLVDALLGIAGVFFAGNAWQIKTSITKPKEG
ncbi:MAG: hypothetical protein NTU91_14370 [Chloroflexi bacterium]|nr:hypothetical protein [Chloroflexota bacterium]